MQRVKPINPTTLLIAVAVFGLGLSLWVINGDRVSSLLAAPAPGHKPRTQRQQIGVEQLEERLGAAAPTGRSIAVGHVEGGVGDYLPDLDSKAFQSVRAVARSGPSKFNGHAFATATIIYGPNGLAPGVADVNFYTTSHWMTTAVLRTGTDQPPQADGRRLFTHSWIGPGGRFAEEVVRRADYLIDHDDVLMVVGVNNNAESPVPGLMASAYNTIAVGVASGKSSGGYTAFEGPGRCKPDIVAPAGRTSFSTPIVAAIVARLLETADTLTQANPAGCANRSEVIKAVLLAGAVKPGRWQPAGSHPLDEHLGAGVARVDLSYKILTAVPSTPGEISAESGWAFESLAPATGHSYEFKTDGPLGVLSLMLVWNRRVDGRRVQDLLTNRPRWIDLPRLADFDLKLYRLDDTDQATLIGQSVSRVDNVEHVYKKGLPPGRYRIEVVRNDNLGEDWDYALAWRMRSNTREEK